MLKKLALVGLAVFAGKRWLERSGGSTGGPAPVGHAAHDLDRDMRGNGSTRADPHFRPDPHGSVPEEDLEGLRPVTFKPAAVPAGYRS